MIDPQARRSLLAWVVLGHLDVALSWTPVSRLNAGVDHFDGNLVADMWAGRLRLVVRWVPRRVCPQLVWIGSRGWTGDR